MPECNRQGTKKDCHGEKWLHKKENFIMEAVFDKSYLLAVMEKMINTPSPVSYYEEVNPLLEELAGELGYPVEFDRKRTGYIKVKGKNP